MQPCIAPISTAAIQGSILLEEVFVFLRLLHKRFLSGKSYKAVVTINSWSIGTALQKKRPPLNFLVGYFHLKSLPQVGFPCAGNWQCWVLELCALCVGFVQSVYNIVGCVGWLELVGGGTMAPVVCSTVQCEGPWHQGKKESWDGRRLEHSLCSSSAVLEWTALLSHNL